MPRVRIEPDATALEVAPHAGLMDALDAAGSTAIPFGCRDASCARCLVRVTAGRRGLQAPGPDELRLLEGLGIVDDVRLGCQLTAADWDGEVVLRVPSRR